jgi:hypothetical protein
MDMVKNLFAFGKHDFTGFRALRCANNDRRPSIDESCVGFVLTNSMARFAPGEN